MNHLTTCMAWEGKLPLPRTNQTFRRETIRFDELMAIVDGIAAESRFVCVRNRCILKLLWATGMRISELLGLRWSDVGPTHVVVISKGNKVRHIPYRKGSFDEIASIAKSPFVISTAQGKPLSYSAVSRFFKSLDRPNFTPHSLRHSYASRLLHSGVPVNYVSELLGHASVDTTLVYLHYRSDDIVRELELKD